MSQAKMIPTNATLSHKYVLNIFKRASMLVRFQARMHNPMPYKRQINTSHLAS